MPPLFFPTIFLLFCTFSTDLMAHADPDDPANAEIFESPKQRPKRHRTMIAPKVNYGHLFLLKDNCEREQCINIQGKSWVIEWHSTGFNALQTICALNGLLIVPQLHQDLLEGPVSGFASYNLFTLAPGEKNSQRTSCTFYLYPRG